ncbi:MAG TPA: ATP-binding protein [Armatimonadota bacterium]|jgi:anti-sigma regulatory factor (Ser/Thr protein kinase)
MSDRAFPSGGTRVAFSFPADPGSIAEARHLIVSEASTLPFSSDDLDDIALAISEAFTNLVQYAPGYRIRGYCEINPRQLEVRFEIDRNLSQFLEHRQFPTGLSHGGRGIPLLNLLIPEIEITEREDGTAELRLVKPVTHEKENG